MGHETRGVKRLGGLWERKEEPSTATALGRASTSTQVPEYQGTYFPWQIV